MPLRRLEPGGRRAAAQSFVAIDEAQQVPICPGIRARTSPPRIDEPDRHAPAHRGRPRGLPLVDHAALAAAADRELHRSLRPHPRAHLGRPPLRVRAGEDGLLPAGRNRSQAHLRRLHGPPLPHARPLGPRLRPDAGTCSSSGRRSRSARSTSSRRTSSPCSSWPASPSSSTTASSSTRSASRTARRRILILGIIFTMMVADITYDGAALALAHKFPELCPPGTRRRARRSVPRASARSSRRTRASSTPRASRSSRRPPARRCRCALKKLSPARARHRRAGRLLDALDARR